jgi:hypothetical protein
LIFRINAGAGRTPSGPDVFVFMPRIFRIFVRLERTGATLATGASPL